MTAQPLTPDTFGPYRIATRIATGGMAEVFAARKLGDDGAPGPMIALKRLLPHLVKDPNVVRMFLNEARITAQIHHPNVVRVLDLGNAGGEPFITMELLEGHSFADLRQRAAMAGARVPLGITLRVLTDACRGLDAAHRAMDEEGRLLCIVHRDFTPENIHVGVDGQARVIDFGIAKAQNMGGGTEPGILKGKFFYLSPEMIAGRPVDHRADLYAAGVMLYEQLCGRRPFTGTTPDEVVRRIAEGQLRRPTEFDPSIPPALEAICLMALERDPELRFQSLKAFITAIESVGGAAELATREELAAWVERVFPAVEDESRERVRRARALDPSGPDLGSAAAPAARAVSASASAAAPASESASGPAPELRAAAPRARSSHLKWIAAAAVAVVLAAAALGLLLLAPAPDPASLLAAAEATEDRGLRARHLGRLDRAKDPSPEQLERGAQLLLDAQAPADALRLVDARLVRFPDGAAARLLEARASIGVRQGKRAETALGAARALAPESAEPDVVLAELRELQGDLSGAANALGAALDRAPGAHALAVRHGYLLSQAGRLPEAEEALAAALKRRFDAEAAAELGFVRYRQDRPQDALPLLRRALRERPGFFRAHYYLGAVLYRQGDTAGAERAYAEAERLAPEDPRPLLALCELAGRAGRKDALAAAHQRIDAKFGADAAALKRKCGVAP